MKPEVFHQSLVEELGLVKEPHTPVRRVVSENNLIMLINNYDITASVMIASFDG